MKSQKIIAGGVLSIATLVAATNALSQTPQPWQSPYSGVDATGPNVIGLWHFDADAPGADASGKGHALTVRGNDSRYVADGKFGGALLVEEKAEPGDKPQGASMADKDDLTPAGPFSIEMWFSPDANLAKMPVAFLLDKKYFHYNVANPAANRDYLLLLRRVANDQFVVQAQLGFGEDSEIMDSAPQKFVAGQWYHVAFTYDGKGNALIYLNGARVGEAQMKGRGAVANGPHPLVIGDRVGSTVQRFSGRIDEVRLTNSVVRYVSGQILVDAAASRMTFVRKEANAKVQLRVFNDTPQPLSGAAVRVQVPGVLNQRLPLPALASGASTLLTIPVQTSLRPAKYQLSARVENAQGKMVSKAATFPITIVARPLPNQIPVILWAGSNEPEAVKAAGFTGYLLTPADYSLIWKNGATSPAMQTSQQANMRQTLDNLLGMQLAGYAELTPGRYAPQFDPSLNRVDRTGKPIDNADGLLPRVQQYSYDVGSAVARSFGDLPALKGSLIHTEIRDHTAPSFHDVDKDAYRKVSGQEIPQQVVSSRGVNYQTVPDFPASRIVSDNHPVLKYYRWFWRGGDAWNTLNTLVDKGLKSTGRKDLLTWFDPAVRTPSIWGSGGKVDFINQWTYTYPNPLQMGLATDEMFAMAEGQPGQKVMKMTQIIWYRSQTTKKPEPGKETEWEKVSPDAQFISISPDHLSEALWLKLSRPVEALAYHGWGSMGEKLGYAQGSYVTTNLDTKKRLKSLVTNVVEPLAPALSQVPDAKADVAFLQSFSSQIFANRGTYGWGGGWGADSYMIANFAGLQPKIVYDETIQQKGLDGYKVLFLTHSDVLSESVAAVIRKFQQNGGIVVGDEFLAPGIQPDILLTSMKRDKPLETKALMLQKAAELRGELDAFYQRAVESSNPEVVTRHRRFASSDYIFTVNDHRTYGDYVGQHQLVMEKGLPSQSRITLNRNSGFVYDLMSRRAVPTTKTGGNLQFSVNLGAGEGNVFLVTDKPAGALKITAPAAARRGHSTPVTVQLNDSAGKSLSAVIPLEVTIRDPQGRVAEKSGHYGGANGKLSFNLDIAPNDATGKWQIIVRERLTGKQLVKSFIVR